jgi:hypothetical protein
MREKYLGDSYDIVKRFWAQSLEPIGKLFAHPKFIPSGIRSQFEAITLVQLLPSSLSPAAPFGILLDPDTGIPLPTQGVRTATVSHATLSFIGEELRRHNPAYLICFDQSYHRKHSMTRAEQRAAKRAFLAEQQVASFYYVSHAPFLFTSLIPEILKAVQDRLVSCGIPHSRFEQ